jgi:hypothetical protein
MVLSFGVWLVVLGLLGASSLMIAGDPKSLVARVTPHQGWVGAVSVVYGAWAFVEAAARTPLLMVKPPIGMLVWLLWVANAGLLLALGLLLGARVLVKFARNEAALQKMRSTFRMLEPFQLGLAVTAVGLGIVFTLMQIVV